VPPPLEWRFEGVKGFFQHLSDCHALC
jgi:hypothetical protein